MYGLCRSCTCEHWYTKAGKSYPPVYLQWFIALTNEVGFPTRELEIVWLYEITAPMSESLAMDVALNLSQAISRCAVATGEILQCIKPESRLWWRRLRRWMLAPEHAHAQGFVLEAVASVYRHKEIVNLFGNSCAASSC